MRLINLYGLKILTWTVFIATAISLYLRFHHLKEDFSSDNLLFDIHNIWFLIIVCFLMMVNWSIEAKKWTIVTRFLEPVTFFKALKGVLMGIAVSLIFPNRTENFLAKS